MTGFEDAERYGSETIVSTGDVTKDTLNEIARLLLEVNIEPEGLRFTDTFEELFAGLYAWKFKTMLAKQKDYGPENITKAGEKGILTRMTDKVERNKVLIGDSDQQLDRIKKLAKEGEPEDLVEMNSFLNKLDTILYPEAQNESIVDTWGDAGNYGDIGVTVHVGAWPKPLQENA